MAKGPYSAVRWRQGLGRRTRDFQARQTQPSSQTRAGDRWSHQEGAAGRQRQRQQQRLAHRHSRTSLAQSAAHCSSPRPLLLTGPAHCATTVLLSPAAHHGTGARCCVLYTACTAAPLVSNPSANIISERTVRCMFHSAEMHKIKEGRTESQVICCPTRAASRQHEFS